MNVTANTEQELIVPTLRALADVPAPPARVSSTCPSKCDPEGR
jgi:hypothetical protein